MSQIKAKVAAYVSAWRTRGYPDDIPDEVPHELMVLGLAPSYKAIALAILSNDHALTSLGFTTVNGPCYMAIKKLEIEARTTEGVKA